MLLPSCLHQPQWDVWCTSHPRAPKRRVSYSTRDTQRLWLLTLESPSELVSQPPTICHYHRLSTNKEYISVPFFMYKAPTGLQFYPKHICKKACNLLLLPSPRRFFLKPPQCPSPHQVGSKHSLEIQQEDKVFHREGGSQRGDVPSAEDEDTFVLPSPGQGRPHLMGCRASHGLDKSVQGQGKEKECTGHTLIKQ